MTPSASCPRIIALSYRIDNHLRPFKQFGVEVFTTLGLPDDEAKHLHRLGFKFTAS
jgi:hypothetical protein